MLDLIEKVYNYDTHKSSTEPNSISATGLLGSKYQAKQTLAKTPKDPSLVPIQFKRSSTIGTAFHEYAERVLEGDPSIHTEVYREREIVVDSIIYTISGSCDIIQKIDDDLYQIADWKTSYGKTRKPDALIKDAKQMSIYRWLLQDEFNISDEAYTLFISQSNNAQDAIPVQLMGIEQTQEWIEANIYAITSSNKVDCFEAPYHPCHYCEFECKQRKIK